MEVKSASLLPLSLAQRDFLAPRGNINASVRFRGELSVPALRLALGFILRRHEGLRMRLVRTDGQVLQRIVEPGHSYDLPFLSVDDFAAAERRLATYLPRPVDLERDGPLYAELMRVSADDHVLLLAIHTIAIDAHALALLLRELLAAYDCYARGEEPSLPAAMRYSDYIRGESQRGEQLSGAQLEYWVSVLSGARHPIPKPDATPVTGVARAAASSITSAEAKQVEEFAAVANVSIAAALYAIIFLAVASHYSVDDVSATVTYSGRDSRALETLCAKTARLFPLRLIVDNEMSLSRFATHVQSAFMRAVMASRAPFTAERARAQAGQAADSSALQLIIADNIMPRPELTVPTPHLSAERILMGARPYEGLESDEAAPFRDALVLLLVRDPALEMRRPVIFSAAFHTHVIGETEVRRLLDRMPAIARLACRANQNLTLSELVSRARPRYKASAIR